MADEIVEEFSSSLDDLTFNSKPLINMLTMLADDNVQHAAEIVQVIEARIHKAKPPEKLPAVYLLDSIIKNISNSNYAELFSKNLVEMFCGVFEKVDEKTRQAMWKLRQTWIDIMPNKKLYKLDLRIQRIDPAWPITAQVVEEPVSSIHVNPKFLMKAEAEARAKKEQEEQEALMRQQLLAKQQELLKLQQERLELELAEAKARLPTALPGPAFSPNHATVNNDPMVESTGVSSTATPVNIPTIAVQGIIRDPRAPLRDPRLSAATIASNSPKKDTVAATPLVTKSDTPPISGTSAVNIPSTPQDVAVTPSEGASNLQPTLRSQDQDDRNKNKNKTNTSNNSSKKISPSKNKKTSEDKKNAGSGNRFGSDSHSNRSKSGIGNRSSRSYHHTNSRSMSPEKVKSTIASRSRSRSPRRSIHGMERKEKSGRGRGRDLTIHIRDVEKRSRSPDVDVVIVDPDSPRGETAVENLSEPPAKKVKPAEQSESTLPADFRELFGNQDQDYRQLPTSTFPKVNTTPPTPGTPSSGRWAAFKAERPGDFPFQQPRATLGMPSSIGPFQDVDMRSTSVRRMSTSLPSPNTATSFPSISNDQLKLDIPAGLMLEQLDGIVSEADTQLRTGRLTHEQHQVILKQLAELQKLQKLKLHLATQVSGDKDQRIEQPGSHSLEKPFMDQPGPLISRDPRTQIKFDDSLPVKDSDDRTLSGISQLTDGPSQPRIPDQDLREKVLPIPKPPMPPMMRPPMPPLLVGAFPPRPDFPHLHQNNNFNQTDCINLPYDTNKYYIPEHDPRWVTQKNDGNHHKLYIDERAYELPLGCPSRQIMLGSSNVQVSMDISSRGIKIDGICYYKIGDQPRKVTINGITCMIMYRGPEKKLWIDDLAYEVYTDGGPQPIKIADKEHQINIDTIMNQVIIDGQVVCPFGGPKKVIEIGYQKHEVQFEPPPRKILIDGKLCEMNFKRKYPCVNTEGKDYGIRFDGPPKEMRVDGTPWLVEMALPRKIKVKERIHVVAFGGPGHEVIINGQWYEIKFNGAPKVIKLGISDVEIQLVGGPPEVKILGEVVSDSKKVHELVGGAYIDPTSSVMSSPCRQPLTIASPSPNLPPRPLMQHTVPQGMPPRDGFRDSPPLRGGIPPHVDKRGRGSPQFDDRGRNSPNLNDYGPQMHGMDSDHLPHPMHNRDGPRQNFHRDGPRAQFGGPPHRGYRGGQLPRMRGNQSGHGGRGFRDDFYGPRHNNRGGPPRMPMHHNTPNIPPNIPQNGPPNLPLPPNLPPNVPPPDNFYFNRPPPPLPDQPYGLPPPMPPPPVMPPPMLTTQIDVNDLFGKLVSSGIIKKAEDPTTVPTPLDATTTNSTDPQSVQDIKPETTEQSKEANDSLKPDEGQTPTKEALPEVPDMTDFNLENMKIRSNTVLQRMYSGIQCSSCGVRFITEDMDKYREHLDWHFRQNRRNQDGVKVAKFRQWYYTTNEWIQFEEIGDLEERGHSMYFEKLLQAQPLPGSTGALQAPEAPISCPAATGNASEDVCGMCGEQFENFFDEETEEWCLRDAVRFGNKTYHPACYEDVGETSIMETPTPEAPEDGMQDGSMSNPLAFLSQLAIINPQASEISNTSNTETSATDVKEEMVVKSETVELDQVEAAAPTIKDEVDVPENPLPSVKIEGNLQGNTDTSIDMENVEETTTDETLEQMEDLSLVKTEQAVEIVKDNQIKSDEMS